MRQYAAQNVITEIIIYTHGMGTTPNSTLYRLREEEIACAKVRINCGVINKQCATERFPSRNVPTFDWPKSYYTAFCMCVNVCIGVIEPSQPFKAIPIA